MKRVLRIIIILLVLLLYNCKSKDNFSDNNILYSDAVLSMEFDRLENSNDFDVIVKISGLRKFEMERAEISVFSNKGKIKGVRKEGENKFIARIDVDGTGEYKIRAQLNGSDKKIEKTAVVLSYVSEDWNQAEKVRGYVNTKGWEDGAFISADGQWLFIQYLPVPIDCMFSGNPKDKTCTKAVGPVDAPYRPDMPGAERVSADGTIRHECPSLNFYDSPFPVPPNSLYVFKRQKDGSFKDPHPIYFKGVDGCLSPFGPTLLKGKGGYIFLFAFDNPFLNNAELREGDLYAMSIELGENFILGRFEWEDGKIVLRNFNGKIIGNPLEGHQGNPQHWIRKDGKIYIFYDDENRRKDLFVVSSVKGIFSEEWDESRLIPFPVSSPANLESQPFFDGKRIYFRRDVEILSSEWMGENFSTTSSWGKIETVLKGEGFSAKEGRIIGVGEPSIANVNGHRELYFVYIIVTSEGTMDLNVAFVKSR